VVVRVFCSVDGENGTYARRIRSASCIAEFVPDANEPAHWFDTGRCYERCALQCVTREIRTAMISQPMEVASVRPQLAVHLGLGAVGPDLVVRFGYGPRMPQSLRRPVDSAVDHESTAESRADGEEGEDGVVAARFMCGLGDRQRAAAETGCGNMNGIHLGATVHRVLRSRGHRAGMAV